VPAAPADWRRRLHRVYVGAHNPLDVICGPALGVAIGSYINLMVTVPADVRMNDTTRANNPTAPPVVCN
jgi:hypothetical protein